MLVVQWFSRFTEIPENKWKLLKRKVSPQEVFYDETPRYNVDIALETIIKTVTVVPLHLWEELPVTLKKADTFYIKQSWDGKCFKDLTPDIFSKLKGSNKEGLGTSKAFIPLDTVSPVRGKEPEPICESAINLENTELGIEQLNSVYMAILGPFGSLECNRFYASWFCVVEAVIIFSTGIFRSLTRAFGFAQAFWAGPTRSPESQLQGSEVLNQDTLAPLKSPPMMNFIGILSSPSKFPCPNDKSQSMFYTSEEWPRFTDTIQLCPYSKVRDISEKAKDLDMKENTEKTVIILNSIKIKQEEDSQSSSDTSYSSDWEEDDDIQYIPEKKHSFTYIPKTSPSATPETSRPSHASRLAEARLR